jgi:hypothetical protein
MPRTRAAMAPLAQKKARSTREGWEVAVGRIGWLISSMVQSNGSRLSCGRHARGRKELEQQIKRLVGEATQFFLTWERPAASSAC